MRSSVFVVSVCCAVTVVTLVACSAAPIPDDLANNNDQSSTVVRPVRKTDAGTPTPAPTGTTNPPPTPTPTPTPTDQDGGTTPVPTPTGTCSASATQGACFTCCEKANPKALPILDQAFGQCACVSPGACANACSVSFCQGNPPPAGGSCDACLSANDPSCGQKADTACLANADCKPLFACDDASGCAAKPK